MSKLVKYVIQADSRLLQTNLLLMGSKGVERIHNKKQVMT